VEKEVRMDVGREVGRELEREVGMGRTVENNFWKFRGKSEVKPML
jgi:hypothetical protein